MQQSSQEADSIIRTKDIAHNLGKAINIFHNITRMKEKNHKSYDFLNRYRNDINKC